MSLCKSCTLLRAPVATTRVVGNTSADQFLHNSPESPVFALRANLLLSNSISGPARNYCVLLTDLTDPIAKMNQPNGPTDKGSSDIYNFRYTAVATHLASTEIANLPFSVFPSTTLLSPARLIFYPSDRGNANRADASARLKSINQTL